MSDDPRTRPPSGPLGKLLARLVREGDARTNEETGGATAYLASLLDLRASVEIAKALDRELPPAAALDKADVAHDLRARMLARIATIGRGVGETRVAGLPGVPSYSAVMLISTLRVAGAVGDEREARGVERATRMLWSPVAGAIARRASRAQIELDAVFTDHAQELADLSPRASHVIGLDALLDRVTEAGMAPLLDRPAELLARRFSSRLTRALDALSAEALSAPKEADVAAWSGGWIADHLARADAFLRALVEHRVRRARALVEACCTVEPAKSD